MAPQQLKRIGDSGVCRYRVIAGINGVEAGNSLGQMEIGNADIPQCGFGVHCQRFAA